MIHELDAILKDERPEGVAPADRGAMYCYLWTVTMGEELAPMHGMFRCRMLERIPLRRCLAGDHVLVTSCVLQGALKALPGHLYRIRDLDRVPRAQTRLKRITGRGGTPTDFQSTLDGHLSDFDLFVPPGSPGAAWLSSPIWVERNHPARSARTLKDQSWVIYQIGSRCSYRRSSDPRFSSARSTASDDRHCLTSRC